MNIENQIDDAENQIDDAENQIAIKLDRVASVLAILFERFQPESTLESIPEHHLGSLADCAMSELAQVRALLDSGRIISALQEAI